MKEIIWIHVPKQYKDKLVLFNKFYSYDYAGDIAFRLINSTKHYHNMIDFIEQENINYEVFRREFVFSKLDIERSNILRLVIDGQAKDSSFCGDNNDVCSCCSYKMPIAIKCKLQVDLVNIKKYDISMTYSGEDEIIISKRLKEILIENNVDDIEFHPVYDLRDSAKVISDYYHLILHVGIGEVIEPTITVKDNKCPCCGHYDELLIQSPLCFKDETWNRNDMCYTKEWFGNMPNQTKEIIISQRLYKILLEHKVKGFSVHPAFLVD